MLKSEFLNKIKPYFFCYHYNCAALQLPNFACFVLKENDEGEVEIRSWYYGKEPLPLFTGSYSAAWDCIANLAKC